MMGTTAMPRLAYHCQATVDVRGHQGIIFEFSEDICEDNAMGTPVETILMSWAASCRSPCPALEYVLLLSCDLNVKVYQHS